jgi:hypothetical protein
MPPDGGFGDDAAAGCRFLIMERLGPDLEVLLSQQQGGAGLAPALVRNYGQQMLEALRVLHEVNKVRAAG